MRTSTDVRERAKAIVCTPPPMRRSASRWPVSSAELRMPSSSLATGGLTTRMCFRPAGAPLSSISSTGASRTRSASSRGFAIVALAQMKIGSAP